MTVAEPETPASALMLVARAAADTLVFLHYALLWVGIAGSVATVIVRRALGEVEVSPVLYASSSATFYSLSGGLLLFPVAMMLRFMRSDSDDSDDSDDEKDIRELLKTPRQIVRKILGDTFMIGYLVAMPFAVLILAGMLVVGRSPLKGSQREQIGSALKDVGILGVGAAHCFIMSPPTQLLRQWRMK